MAKKFSTTIKLGSNRNASPAPRRQTRTGATSSGGGYNLRSTGSGRHFRTFSGSGGSWSGLDSHQRSSAPGKYSFKTAIGGGKSKTKLRKRILKFGYTALAVFGVLLVIGTLGGLAYMQTLTADLPDPEKPFDNPKFKAEASVMVDRNGKELYRLFGNDNRDIVRMNDKQELSDVVPAELIWSILAAEDIDFYQHPGIDVTALLRCSIRLFSNCGGSTITQQVVKLAGFERKTRDLRLKLQEIVLALQMENKVKDKDKVLLLYMNLVNEGGNMYGVKIAAKNYFGKELKDLTLEEAVVIAAIPNNPNLLSPTRSVNAEVGKKQLEARTKIIYDNLLRYKDKINSEVRTDREARAKRDNRELTAAEKKDVITEERVAKARETVLAYKEYQEEIKAPHFVFFARDLLTKRGYNRGEAFTLEEINKGGYRITTTLDLDMQNSALDIVQNVAMGKDFAGRYGNKNAAMMTMLPRTGEILTMIGSRCYDNREQANCTEIDKQVGGGQAKAGDAFDPKVNILISEQQPGSSIKPAVYLEAYRQGKLAPGSTLADVPIQIGNYRPKNSDGRYIGINSARHMLATSRNIPAITGIQTITPAKLAEVKKELGYTTNIDPAQYGPSAALGSQDVLGVEHATAFAAFANGGKYVPYEAILKIVDKNGEVVYELGNKDKDYHEEPKQVVDEKAVFLVNDSTNPRSKTGSDSPVKWKGNRDVAGKTGTSNENRDNWFIAYSPDIVVLSWAGSNDNTPMANGAFGSTNAEPWVRRFLEKVGDTDYFKAKTPFNRPNGIVRGKICSDFQVGDRKLETCEPSGDDYYIGGLEPPVYQLVQKAEVCIDQQDKLARDIDRLTGNVMEKEFKTVKMPVDSLQKFVDEFLKDKGGNGVPTEQCNVPRSPNGENPWAIINSPIAGSTSKDKISANISAYTPAGTVTKFEVFLGDQLLRTNQSSSFQGQLDVPNGTLSGDYDFRVKVYDDRGKSGFSAVRIKIDGVDTGLKIISPTGGTKNVGNQIEVIAEHNGQLSNLTLLVDRRVNGAWVSVTTVAMAPVAGPPNRFSASFTPAAGQAGQYRLRVRAITPITVTSPAVQITVED